MTLPTPMLPTLLTEHGLAGAHSLDLVADLDAAQVAWRPHEESSAIGWHLGHQAAVNHYMVRNLTAAERSNDEAFDRLFDSETPEPGRGDLPPLDEIVDYRRAIAASTRSIVERIAGGDVGAPAQLERIAVGMMTAIINHEYQHAKWIAEVRAELIGDPGPSPASDRLVTVDGYYMLS